MKIKLLFLFLILFYNITSAQQETSKKNRFEFSIGYNSGALRNLDIAPVNRYDYSGLIYKFGYERQTKNNNLFNVLLDYLTSEIQSEVIPALNLDYTKFGLSFSFLKKVYTNNKLSLHLGLQSYSNVSVYSKDIYNEFAANQSFGVTSQLAYQINNKHKLLTNITTPFFLLRITHLNRDITHSLSTYQGVLFNLGYNYSLSDHFDATIKYNFNYDRLQDLSSFREMQNQLNLGVKFKF